MLMSSYEGHIKGIRAPLMTPVNSELVTTATEERVIVERRFENLGKWQLNPHAYPFVYQMGKWAINESFGVIT